MTTDRPYRSALPLEKALAELRANAGTQFDPAVAEALARLVQRQGPEQAPRPAATPASAVPVATLPLSP
jgi:HD-GYP domain-containing protein (c-di-GMP phosphodiesterase class II)